jgi:3-oxoacyl-[acyl-carrier protein] reductase
MPGVVGGAVESTPSQGRIGTGEDMAGGALAGQVALVTGAGRGIGRAIALGFAADGARVCCAARSRDEVDAVAAAITGAGGAALAVAMDVTDEASVEAGFAACESAFGGPDLVVANAGVSPPGAAVADTDLARWRLALDVNLTGSFLTARAAIPRFRRRGGGNLILVGSGNGRRASARGSAYACSKAGLWMLTRVLAQELLDDHVLVNELVPGPVRTQLLGERRAAAIQRGELPGVRGEWLKSPEDVVPLARFIATLPRDGPTGQTFALNRREL